MNNEQIKDLVYIIVSILLGILAVKFIIWLLPIILIAAISYYLYRKISRPRNIKTNNYKEKKTHTKKKEIKIIDMEEK